MIPATGLAISEVLVHGVQPTDSPKNIAKAAKLLGFKPAQIGIELDVLSLQSAPVCITRDEATSAPLVEVIEKFLAANFGGLIFLDFKRGDLSTVLALAQKYRRAGHPVAVWPGMEALLRFLPGHESHIKPPENWKPRLLALWSGGTWAGDTSFLDLYLTKVLVWEPLGNVIEEALLPRHLPKFKRVVYKLPFEDPSFLSDPQQTVERDLRTFADHGGNSLFVPFGSIPQIKSFLDVAENSGK